jgi:pilus assembly protein CpaE
MDMSTIITFLGIVDFIPTIKNMKIGCDTIRSLGYEGNKVRLVLNRSNSKTKIDLADVEALLDEPFYHVLPNAFDAAKESIEKGIPLVFTSDNNLSMDIKTLVRRYTNREQVEEESSGGWFSKLFKG